MRKPSLPRGKWAASFIADEVNASLMECQELVEGLAGLTQALADPFRNLLLGRRPVLYSTLVIFSSASSDTVMDPKSHARIMRGLPTDDNSLRTYSAAAHN